MRRLLRRTGLLAFQAACALLLLEGVLRLVGPLHPDLRALLYQPSVRHDYDRFETLEELMGQTVVGWRPGRPRVGFLLNSRSFRTHEYTGPVTPGGLRIMALGDSFTDASGGVPFRDMWSTRLGERLRERLGRPVDVFALGVPGVGPMFELRLFELEHKLVRPGVVVLAFFVGNDFFDERGRPLDAWSGEGLAHWSHAFRAFRNLARELGSRREVEEARAAAEALETDALGVDLGGEPVDDALRTRTPERFLEIEASRFEVCRTDSEPFRQQVEIVGALLRRLDAEVRAAGAELVVMAIPDEFQVDPELAATLTEHLELDPATIDLDQPQAALARICAEAKIAYLDLLPAFRERTRQERLYWLRNTHWNLRGHELAAELLAGFLVELLAEEVQ